MKAKFLIIGYLLLAIASCTSKVKVVEPVETPSSELCAIDNLMWRQPDSALAQLQAFCNSPEADSLDEFNRHYCQLLISELLYKNDWGQSNREELLQAVAYFDSLVRLTPPLQRGLGGLKNTPTNQNDNLVFLAARAHYINGAGYYEKDSVVNACAEYLKALEVMEEHFEEKERVGNMAKFMALTHGRLGEMFEEQLLAEPAIACYKQALFYCRREPTSKYGIPVLLYHLGIQYDIVDQKDSAAFYYDEALANMPDFDNLHYRDLMSNKAIFAFYNLDYSSDSVINILKHLVTLSADEEERTTRLLTLGHILFEDKQYDSSRLYLETVFEKQKNIPSKILAAKNLYNIYQKKGNSIKAQEYASFLADFTMLEIEKKTAVSKVNEMFKEHLTQKQEKESEEEREKAIRRVIRIIIPIAVLVALVIIAMARQRNAKLMKEQQEEADRVLKDRDKRHAEAIEAERQAHRMEQAALSGRLKRSNAALREKEKMEYFDRPSKQSHYDRAENYFDEPICQRILSTCNDENNPIKSSIPVSSYANIALTDAQKVELKNAALAHYASLFKTLKQQHPELKEKDFLYCYLSLLGLDNAQIAVMTQLSYRTVWEREKRLQHIFQKEERISITLNEMMIN